MNKLKPGPIQSKWLKSLHDHPERQMHDLLGFKKSDGTYRACCLGEYCLIAGKGRWDHDCFLISEDNSMNKSMSLIIDYDEFGMIDGSGTFVSEARVNGTRYKSLAQMNDLMVPWPEIARYVKNNFDNVFIKSI